VSGAVLAGSYALDGTGTVVTFTALSPLPGTDGHGAGDQVCWTLRERQQLVLQQFTTGSGTDTVAPVVTMGRRRTGDGDWTERGSRAYVLKVTESQYDQYEQLWSAGERSALPICQYVSRQPGVTLTPYGYLHRAR